MRSRAGSRPARRRQEKRGKGSEEREAGRGGRGRRRGLSAARALPPRRPAPSLVAASPRIFNAASAGSVNRLHPHPPPFLRPRSPGRHRGARSRTPRQVRGTAGRGRARAVQVRGGGGDPPPIGRRSLRSKPCPPGTPGASPEPPSPGSMTSPQTLESRPRTPQDPSSLAAFLSRRAGGSATLGARARGRPWPGAGAVCSALTRGSCPLGPRPLRPFRPGPAPRLLFLSAGPAAPGGARPRAAHSDRWGRSGPWQ